ncbi:MAG: hypothetical protein IT204_08210 [Fimbriimonadaceae bacterium]|nr:hypothetical protein [Fimbriimonadaceae bacterium]
MTTAPPPTQPRRLPRAVVGLALLGLLTAAVRLSWAAASNVWTGADSFYYAALANNLHDGRGFVVDYVLYYFQRYPQVAGRPDDWLSPLYPLSMVPCIWVFGKTYAAYAAPSILAHSLLFPQVVRAVARALGGSERVACLAAVSGLLHPTLFLNAQAPMSDLPFACLAGGCLWAVLTCGPRARDGWLAGLCLGLAMLLRPVGPWLLPVLPLCYALRHRRLRALVAPPLLLMVALALLLASPWWLRNQRLFGSPTWSVYQYQGPLGGRLDTDIGDAYGYWWDRTPPTLRDRYLHGQGAWLQAAKHLAWGVDMCFVGSIKSANRVARIGLGDSNYHPVQALLGLPALALLWRRRRRWQMQVVAVFVGSLIAAIAVANVPAFPRYFFAVWPPLLAVGWMAWEALAERLQARTGRPAPWWLAGPALLLWGAGLTLDVWRGRQMQLPVLASGRAALLADRAAALAAAERCDPGTVLLFEGNPAMVNYWSRCPAVRVPPEVTPAQLAEIVAHYRLRHAVVNRGQAVEPMLRALGWRDWFATDAMVGLQAPQ